MNRKLYLTKKQIITIAIVLLMFFVIVILIYINVNKRDKVKLEANQQNYIITEVFKDNVDYSRKIYEVRYYKRDKKSYLILSEQNGYKVNKTVTEIETEFTKDYVNFTIDNVPSKIKDLTEYADDSGFIYACKIKDIQEFLANEGNTGKIRFAYGTPSYFECYIENQEGNIMRGLLLYDSDMKTGTLIYKKCNKNIKIPTVMDKITIIKDSETP